MKKKLFFFSPIFIVAIMLFESCAPSDADLQETIVNTINNKDIMVDVTEGHVSLSGFIYDTNDTVGFSEKILSIKGINSLENNISFFSKDELK